ncbi:unnamed protein product [Malus baccata var. baccata]
MPFVHQSTQRKRAKLLPKIPAAKPTPSESPLISIEPSQFTSHSPLHLELEPSTSTNHHFKGEIIDTNWELNESYVMERYYKKQCLNHPSNISGSPSPSNIPSSPPPPSNIPRSHHSNIPSRSQQSEATELDEILANLPADPAYRRRMLDYPPNYPEVIRRHYLQVDLCQPRDHIMPRKFKWLEYSISKNVAFCCYCYLFKCDFDQMGSTRSDVFTKIGFTNWKKGPENLRVHEGGVESLHNKVVQQARDLMTQKKHIKTFVIKQTDEAHINYCTLLSVSLECARRLLGQGLPFRGPDESLKPSNRGNYLELINSLEEAIERLFTTTNLSMSKLRGQCYDGASNTKGELNGLKTKILNKYLQAFHIHCFAHQLQLAFVFVTKENEDDANFFINTSSLVNLIGSSCKLRDVFREKQQEQIHKALDLGNLETGKGLNQEMSLMRPCDTRWNSHYGTIPWWRCLNGLKVIATKIISVNVMSLVEVCKQKLQSLRDDDFGDLLHDVEKFCEEHDIIVHNMEDLHFVPGKSRHKAPKITNFHYYRVDLYFQVLDMQLKELNDLFNEMHSEFSSLRGISDLAKELVKTGRCESYMLVYKLLTLALVLPVATASVEKAFSAMKIVKTPLRNKMGDQ